jgi:hypothetical protein
MAVAFEKLEAAMFRWRETELVVVGLRVSWKHSLFNLKKMSFHNLYSWNRE